MSLISNGNYISLNYLKIKQLRMCNLIKFIRIINKLNDY
jgi:hypothetical protein